MRALKGGTHVYVTLLKNTSCFINITHLNYEIFHIKTIYTTNAPLHTHTMRNEKKCIVTLLAAPTVLPIMKSILKLVERKQDMVAGVWKLQAAYLWPERLGNVNGRERERGKPGHLTLTAWTAPGMGTRKKNNEEGMRHWRHMNHGEKWSTVARLVVKAWLKPYIFHGAFWSGPYTRYRNKEML